MHFGLIICHDINDDRIFKEYAEKGTSVIFESAAPGLPVGKNSKCGGSHFQWWKNECKSKLSKHAKEYGMYIAAATQTGRISDEKFPGGGYVVCSRRQYA